MTALTDALRALALHQDLPECAQAADEIERLRRLATADVVAFLMGEGELDGCWFSERPSDALGAFWWRSHLAELRAAVLDGGAR